MILSYPLELFRLDIVEHVLSAVSFTDLMRKSRVPLEDEETDLFEDGFVGHICGVLLDSKKGEVEAWELDIFNSRLDCRFNLFAERVVGLTPKKSHT